MGLLSGQGGLQMEGESDAWTGVTCCLCEFQRGGGWLSGEGCMGTRPRGSTAEGSWGRQKGCRPLSSDCQVSDLGPGSPLGPLPWPPCGTLLPLPSAAPRPRAASAVRWPLRLCLLLRLSCCSSSLPLPAVPWQKLLLSLPTSGPHVIFLGLSRADRGRPPSPFCPGLPARARAGTRAHRAVSSG